MKPFWLPWNPLSQSRRGGVISFEENKTSCQEKIYKMKKGGKRGIQPTITGLFIIIKMKKKFKNKMSAQGLTKNLKLQSQTFPSFLH